MAGRRSYECSRRKLVIFASELASAVGRHRYQPKEETSQKIWLRSHPQSFCFAYALQFKSDVRSILADHEELTSQFPSLKEEESDIDVDFGAVLRKVICDFSLRKIYDQIVNFLKVKLFKSNKEDQVLVSAKIVEQVAAEVKTMCQNEEKPVESVVKELCAKAGIEKKEVVEAVESKITKDRGTLLEGKAVQDFGKAKGIEIERPIAPELFYKDMEHNGVKWSVCGKVDAETEDSVIEVKNRRNHFMCPEYDYIQLQTYLFIRNKTKGVLLERLKGENKETCIDFDEELWEEVTIDLAEFVTELTDTMSMSKQALYGCSSPRKREHGNLKVAEPNEKVSCQATDKEPEKKVAMEEAEKAATDTDTQGSTDEEPEKKIAMEEEEKAVTDTDTQGTTDEKPEKIAVEEAEETATDTNTQGSTDEEPEKKIAMEEAEETATDAGTQGTTD
ncbi:hypothetical protein OS493_036957 [Desmophyllum pertusum]|uniref:Uncharacterized protein n=1 Tax=Desmophyllum pertusum TaxID=174260 RepID=A0A9W9ZJZ9_9CNID|nr:hypothetical protein OS493_036957 [Desmophyllum pertusum]